MTDFGMTQEEIEKRQALARAEALLPLDQIAFSQRVGEIVGHRKLAEAFSKIATVSSLVELRRIKESKEYKGLKIVGDNNELLTVATWDDFCVHVVARSRAAVDRDLDCLETFGQEALDSLSRIGAGYRDLRALKKLPAPTRDALVAAAQSGDIEDIKLAIEEVTARHAAEKDALNAQLQDAKADIAAKDEVAAASARNVNRLQEQIARLKGQHEKSTPDEIAEKLRLHASTVAHSIRSEIIADGKDVSSLRTRVRSLVEHGEANGIAHTSFLAGLIFEIERDLRALRDEFAIPAELLVDDEPQWIKDARAAGEI